MPGILAALLLSAFIAASQGAGAAPQKVQASCPGVVSAAVERRLPEEVRRYAFEGEMLDPFLRLWQAGRRPRMPIPPQSVTVYAVPGKPYLVGYQSGECTIAFLSVERQKLWQWLRPQLGWPA